MDSEKRNGTLHFQTTKYWKLCFDASPDANSSTARIFWGIITDRIVFRRGGGWGGPVVANRVYSGDHRELIANEGRTQEYFRTLWGNHVNFTVGKPNSCDPPPPPINNDQSLDKLFLQTQQTTPNEELQYTLRNICLFELHTHMILALKAKAAVNIIALELMWLWWPLWPGMSLKIDSYASTPVSNHIVIITAHAPSISANEKMTQLQRVCIKRL